MPGSSFLYKSQILLNRAVRVRVDVHRIQVAPNERHQTRESGFTVNDLINRHQLDGIVIVVIASAVCPNTAFVGRRLALLVHNDGLAEPEALTAVRVLFLRALHVVVHLADGYQKVQLERQDDARQQHHETANGRILKVGQLNFTRPELHTPSNCRLWRRRLETHRLPVGRLDALKVVHLLHVVLVDFFAEQKHRVADEQVRHVLGEQMIDAAIA